MGFIALGQEFINKGTAHRIPIGSCPKGVGWGSAILVCTAG